jgi:hypothetical protein
MEKELILFKINSVLYLRDHLNCSYEDISCIMNISIFVAITYYEIAINRNKRRNIRIS